MKIRTFLSAVTYVQNKAGGYQLIIQEDTELPQTLVESHTHKLRNKYVNFVLIFTRGPSQFRDERDAKSNRAKGKQKTPIK